jgi:acyl-coenzyme A thioesterase PaaI-like protein
VTIDVPARDDYVGLFDDNGRALSDTDWITHANRSLPPNLSALNTQFVTGSRTDQTLTVRYEPGPESFSFWSLSGGVTAEMLDQAATHCGTFVTGHGCPTVTMTTNYFRPGTGGLFVANARVLSMTKVSATVAAELSNERGEQIAAASVVMQFMRDITRFI